MGIYIKGMEMPKDCDECWTKYRGFGWVEHDEEWGTFYCKPAKGFCSDPRTKCPIVSVPPHGDLIDRKALMSRVTDEKGNYYGHDCAVIGEAVESAPTIIPASDD